MAIDNLGVIGGSAILHRSQYDFRFSLFVSVPITLGYNLIQINLGPQHPSTHGVLRIIAFVECETIKSLEPELGLLHRGSEKLIEYRC